MWGCLDNDNGNIPTWYDVYDRHSVFEWGICMYHDIKCTTLTHDGNEHWILQIRRTNAVSAEEMVLLARLRQM